MMFSLGDLLQVVLVAAGVLAVLDLLLPPTQNRRVGLGVGRVREVRVEATERMPAGTKNRSVVHLEPEVLLTVCSAASDRTDLLSRSSVPTATLLVDTLRIHRSRMDALTERGTRGQLHSKRPQPLGSSVSPAPGPTCEACCWGLALSLAGRSQQETGSETRCCPGETGTRIREETAPFWFRARLTRTRRRRPHLTRLSYTELQPGSSHGSGVERPEEASSGSGRPFNMAADHPFAQTHDHGLKQKLETRTVGTCQSEATCSHWNPNMKSSTN